MEMKRCTRVRLPPDGQYCSTSGRRKSARWEIWLRARGASIRASQQFLFPETACRENRRQRARYANVSPLTNAPADDGGFADRTRPLSRRITHYSRESTIQMGKARLTTTTTAPSSIHARVMASPIPAPPPVTTMTRSLSSRSTVSPHNLINVD